MLTHGKTLFLFAVFFIVGELDTLYSQFLKHFYDFIVIRGSIEWTIQCLVGDISMFCLILLIGFQINYIKNRFEIFTTLVLSYWLFHLWLVNPDPYKYEYIMRMSEFFLELILSGTIIIKMLTVPNKQNIKKIMWVMLSGYNLYIFFNIIYYKLIDYHWQPLPSLNILCAFFIFSVIFFSRLKSTIDLSNIKTAEILPNKSYLVLEPINGYESFLKSLFWGHSMHTALYVNGVLYTFKKGSEYFGPVDETISEGMHFIEIPDLNVSDFIKLYRFSKVQNSCSAVANRILKNQTGLSIRKAVSNA